MSVFNLILVDAIRDKFRNKDFIPCVHTVIKKLIQEGSAKTCSTKPKTIIQALSANKEMNSKLSLASIHFLLGRNAIITQHGERSRCKLEQLYF